jgi:hypothetical protein
MTVGSLGTMGIGTLSALVGAFFVFLVLLHLKTLRTLRREAERNAQAEFKAHVRALMNKLDNIGTSSSQGPRMRAVKRRSAKIVPASRTTRLSFPTRSSWRK